MPAATTLRNLAPWLPTGVAVAFLLGSLVTVAGYAVRGDDPAPEPGRAAPLLSPFSPRTPGAPTSPAPQSGAPEDDGAESAIGVADPRRTAPDRRVPEAQRSTPERARATSSTPAQRKPTTGPGGTYRVVDSFPGGFIGEVLVENPVRADADWTVRLTVPVTEAGFAGFSPYTYRSAWSLISARRQRQSDREVMRVPSIRVNGSGSLLFAAIAPEPIGQSAPSSSTGAANAVPGTAAKQSPSTAIRISALLTIMGWELLPVTSRKSQ